MLLHTMNSSKQYMQYVCLFCEHFAQSLGKNEAKEQLQLTIGAAIINMAQQVVALPPL